MKKLVLVMTLAMTVAFSAKSASAKVVSESVAAQRIATVAEKAGKTGKTQKVVVTIKANKKNYWNKIDKVENKADKILNADVALKDAGVMNMLFTNNKAVVYKIKVTKSQFTWMITFKGSCYKKDWKEFTYWKKNVNNFAALLTPDMDEFQKAKVAVCYVNDHFGMRVRGGSEKSFYDRTMYGVCETRANKVVEYMKYAGIKQGTFGTVTSVKLDHAWNWMKVNGVVYWCDAQYVTRDSTRTFEQTYDAGYGFIPKDEFVTNFNEVWDACGYDLKTAGDLKQNKGTEFGGYYFHINYVKNSMNSGTVIFRD